MLCRPGAPEREPTVHSQEKFLVSRRLYARRLSMTLRWLRNHKTASGGGRRPVIFAMTSFIVGDREGFGTGADAGQRAVGAKRRVAPAGSGSSRGGPNRPHRCRVAVWVLGAVGRGGVRGAACRRGLDPCASAARYAAGRQAPDAARFGRGRGPTGATRRARVGSRREGGGARRGSVRRVASSLRLESRRSCARRRGARRAPRGLIAAHAARASAARERSCPVAPRWASAPGASGRVSSPLGGPRRREGGGDRVGAWGLAGADRLPVRSSRLPRDLAVHLVHAQGYFAVREGR